MAGKFLGEEDSKVRALKLATPERHPALLHEAAAAAAAAACLFPTKANLHTYVRRLAGGNSD